jgi:hypothetical protein
MLTSRECRDKAFGFSRQADESDDAEIARRHEAMAAEWSVLEAAVAAMEEAEARFITRLP